MATAMADHSNRTYIRRANDEERRVARAESSRKFREKQRQQLVTLQQQQGSNQAVRSTVATPYDPQLLDHRLEEMSRLYEARIQDLQMRFIQLQHQVNSAFVPCSERLRLNSLE